MKSLYPFLLVFLGGGLGAILRHWIHLLPINESLPHSTLLVNVLGSFCLGLLFVLGKRHEILPETIYLFLGVGLMGGFTTFSTFSMHAVDLIGQAQHLKAGLHVILNNALAIASCFVGTLAANFLK